METALCITRVINACVLLELDGDAVLTDPYFQPRWFLRLRERIGLEVEQLPRLAAILGGHGVPDHWHLRSLAAYPYKDSTPVYVATPGMRKQAEAAGFRHVEVLGWGEARQLTPRLRVEVTPRQTSGGMKVNSYVLTAGALRVLIGTEARDLEPLREYRLEHAAVEVALLPIDGSALLGHKLVMDERDALAAAQILGARTLVPIHYANQSYPLLMQTPGSLATLERAAQRTPEIRVVALEPGERWRYRRPDAERI